ncbi:hypothetical protein D3C81_2009160 [compost metagenome]
MVVLFMPLWCTKTSASAMPKLKDASAADNAAALSWALLSPAATLKPMLPEASEPTSSAMDASFSNRPFSAVLSEID